MNDTLMVTLYVVMADGMAACGRQDHRLAQAGMQKYLQWQWWQPCIFTTIMNAVWWF